MVCLSSNCERYADCARTFPTQELEAAEYLDTYGSGYVSGYNIVEKIWCGPRGDYAMFIPKEEKT